MYVDFAHMIYLCFVSQACIAGSNQPVINSTNHLKGNHNNDMKNWGGRNGVKGLYIS